MTRTLILLRHAQSAWNAADRFAGWEDIALSPQGRVEATRCASVLAAAGLAPDVVHTSVLRRAIETAQIVLDAIDRHWIPVRRTWRLNERHYGVLQGQERSTILREFGADQFTRWRRSYDGTPPPIDQERFLMQTRDPRYRLLERGALPHTESLADVVRRLVPHWQDSIARDLLDDQTTLVVAHGNSLRALMMYIDRRSETDVAIHEIPTGQPILYEFADDLVPVICGGRRLDVV